MAALLVIGDEIVSGEKADTNSSLLAVRLGEAGVCVARIVAVGDSLGDVVSELRRNMAEHRLVVATGGLGPTHDDLTRQALAEAFGVRLVLDKPTLAYIEERFRRRGLEAPEDVKSLALVPEGARTIPNPAGAAPGLVFEKGDRAVYVLPGVPREVEAIFAGQVLEEIKQRFGGAFVKALTLRTVGVSESDIARKIADLIPALKVKLAFLPEETGVKLTLRAHSDREDDAWRELDAAAREITARIGDCVYSATGKDLHVVVGKLLIAKRRTIALAESCTGGLISHLLTEVPGISACLERGVVAYSDKAKLETLGVDRSLLETFGAVSEEVARAMACGVRERAHTNIGVATTGIAGPAGGSSEKPVGLVYVALADEAGCQVVRHVLAGGREAIKRRAAARALDMVRCYVLGGR